MEYNVLQTTSKKMVQNLLIQILEKTSSKELEDIEIRSLKEALRKCNPKFQVSKGKLSNMEQTDIDNILKESTRIALRKRERGINLDGEKFDLSTASGYTAALKECKESNFSELEQMDKFDLEEYFSKLHLVCKYDLKESLKFYKGLEQFEICAAINEVLKNIIDA